MSDCETDSDEDCYRAGAVVSDSDNSDSASENSYRCGDVVDHESLEVYFSKLCGERQGAGPAVSNEAELFDSE